MRIAATTTQIRAVALVPAARAGHGREESPRASVPAKLAPAAADCSAAFIAQAIAQELYPESLPPESALADTYRPRPRAAFEGLNFTAIA